MGKNFWVNILGQNFMGKNLMGKIPWVKIPWANILWAKIPWAKMIRPQFLVMITIETFFLSPLPE